MSTDVGITGTTAVIESLSTALLLPGVGSVTPLGGVTVATFTSDPDAAAETVHTAV